MRKPCLALLALYCCISAALAALPSAEEHRRDESTISSIDLITAIKDSNGLAQWDTDLLARAAASVSTSIAGAAPSVSLAGSGASTTIVAATSDINGAAPAISTSVTFFNGGENPFGSSIDTDILTETATPGKLPLTPEITPTFAIAGVMMILSGAVYAFVGIRNKYLHTYLSAAYLASICITVLIVYVMTPPISNAVQGAYFVAIAMTGIILGGVAIVFRELTEGLGCLLGGFCLSMWLLVLKPGGLITSTGGIAGLIAAFTAVSFATSFSHITRPYALIGFISFTGATVIVLGIDCLSRAGLNEFWAYIWNLNQNLFPAGATTYPLTRGMKVEIAVIVVLFLAAILSQIKLWKIIEQRRQEWELELLEEEEQIQQEEEKVGRRIEERNARDLDRWEAIYNEDKYGGAPSVSHDSGVGDMDSHRKGPASIVTTRRFEDSDIEMSVLSSPASANGSKRGTVIKLDKPRGITIRVGEDLEHETTANAPEGSDLISEHPNASPTSQNPVVIISEEESVHPEEDDTEAQPVHRLSIPDPQSAAKHKSIAPAVVPLPFRVSVVDFADEASSIATFADEERPAVEQPAEERHSKRLSAGSAVLRRLSGISKRSSKRISAGTSAENLIISSGVAERPASRASSLAATMDGLSDNEYSRSARSSIVHHDMHESDESQSTAVPLESTSTTDNAAVAATSTQDDNNVLSTNTPACQEIGPLKIQDLPLSSTKSNVIDQEVPDQEVEAADQQTRHTGARSTTSGTKSRAMSLTKEALQPQPSKVVTSYRTNEWAKHLSVADAPEMDELNFVEHSPIGDEKQEAEAVVPVNVEELQQTAESARVAPAHPPPTLSRSSSYSQFHGDASQQSYNSRSFSTRTPPRPATARDSSRAQTQAMQSQPMSTTRSSSTRSKSTSRVVSGQIPGPPGRTNSGSVRNAVQSSFADVTSRQNFQRGRPDSVSHKNSVGRLNSTSRNNSIVRSKSSLAVGGQPLPLTPEVRDISQMPGDYAIDNMSMAQRRRFMKQQTLAQQKAAMSGLDQVTRESQLASSRASIQNDLGPAVMTPQAEMDQHRNQLWMERYAEEQRRAVEGKVREARERGFDERMRNGSMLDAHRQVMRKMQAQANKTTS